MSSKRFAVFLVVCVTLAATALAVADVIDSAALAIAALLPLAVLGWARWAWANAG